MRPLGLFPWTRLPPLRGKRGACVGNRGTDSHNGWYIEWGQVKSVAELPLDIPAGVSEDLTAQRRHGLRKIEHDFLIFEVLDLVFDDDAVVVAISLHAHLVAAIDRAFHDDVPCPSF